MGVHFDTSEVDRLAVDISQAPRRMSFAAPKILESGARKVKRGMRRDARGHRRLPHLPGHVNYDRIGLLEYEIGFDKVGQGNLANILVFGSVNNGPVFDHTAALRRETPGIMRDFGQAAEESVLTEYTTKGGVTRLATAKQIAHWTRGAR